MYSCNCILCQAIDIDYYNAFFKLKYMVYKRTMALWKRYRFAVACSLSHSESLPVDLLLVITRTLEKIRSRTLVGFVHTSILLCRSPPWGGSWPPSWEQMHVHCFSAGRLRSSTSVWYCRNSHATMATMIHRLRFI